MSVRLPAVVLMLALICGCASHIREARVLEKALADEVAFRTLPRGPIPRYRTDSNLNGVEDTIELQHGLGDDMNLNGHLDSMDPDWETQSNWRRLHDGKPGIVALSIEYQRDSAIVARLVVPSTTRVRCVLRLTSMERDSVLVDRVAEPGLMRIPIPVATVSGGGRVQARVGRTKVSRPLIWDWDGRR